MGGGEMEEYVAQTARGVTVTEGEPMSLLEQSVVALIPSGVLPKTITGARLGRGRGGHCAICRAVIRQPDTEIEVDVESRRGVFHRACFNLWRDLVARLS
jgi:hypothetical protein